MTTLAERLRLVVRPARASDTTSSPAASLQGSSESAADVLGGVWHEADGQRYLVVDRTYRPGHRHGRHAVADVLPPGNGGWPGLSLLGASDGGMLFLDLETIGLAGGAGTYAFLVGAAWFDGGVLRMRQWFLSSFAAERVLLTAVAEAAAACGTVVTYNGKTFDLPLLDTRYVLHRLETPFGALTHVDMLHPARRLWRADDEGPSPSGCTLTLLEKTLLGHAREHDVPGFEIPSRYFHYVRTGDARAVESVFEHNRQDLLSLAFVAARAASLLEGPHHATTAREALGLGHLFERGGLTAQAGACYARAAGIANELGGTGIETWWAPLDRVDGLTQVHALRAYALLARRRRCFGPAASAWTQIASLRRCPPHIAQQAIEALAVHHEHRLRDPRAARTLALQSLSGAASAARREAATYRLARLDRKIATALPYTARLF